MHDMTKWRTTARRCARIRRRKLVAALAVPLIAGGGQAHAASFRGKVLTPDGKPAYGAMVTVLDSTHQQRETVYTAQDGSYAIRTPFAGRLQVRARLAGHADVTVAQAVEPEAFLRLDLRLQAFSSDDAAAGALAASAFNAHLPWPRLGKERAAFVSECNYCHQVGNETTRVPRSREEWAVTVDKMEEGMFALLTTGQKWTVADVLSRGFNDPHPNLRQSYGASAELAHAKVHEWLLGDGLTFVHDAFVARDQKVYATDEGHDVLWSLDRASGRIERIALPDIDLPRGGLFAGMKLPIGVFSGKHGPHSMAQTSDGRIWITNSLSSTLMSFDPATRRFQTYAIGHDALYPHTIRADKHGVLWFTILASNQIGRFDPETERFDVVNLPANGIIRALSVTYLPTLMRIGTWFPHQAVHLNLSTHRFLGYSVAPFPYGIDISPVDGGVWYTKLNASKIGRLDPKTMTVEEWDTPMRGPRRPRFDAHGVLWIPAFDDSGLIRFDSRTHSFQTFKIPAIGEGEYETPYAINVLPSTGEVWMSANNSDRILRFSPQTQTFVSYPSPTRVTVLRDFSFTDDGAVCSSSSNLPASAIEDGRPSIICLEPDGGTKDRYALAQRQ